MNEIKIYKKEELKPLITENGIWNYHLFNGNYKDNMHLISRWSNHESLLNDIWIEILQGNSRWDKIIQNKIPYVESAGGRESNSKNETYKYQRDLRGVVFNSLSFTEIKDSLNYTLYDFSSFLDCKFNGNKGNLYTFYNSSFKNSFFKLCQFKDSTIWASKYINTFFCQCKFDNVRFNKVHKAEYKDILFLNCEFNNVDFNEVNIESFCFAGNCTFNKVQINYDSIQLKKTFARTIIRNCYSIDRKWYEKRKKIKSETHKKSENGESIITFNYYKLFERRKKILKRPSVYICTKGMLNFYYYMIKDCTNNGNQESIKDLQYSILWTRDELKNTSLSAKWKNKSYLISRYLLGYGEKPSRPLLYFMLNILVFSFAYLKNGIVYNNKLIKRELIFSFSELKHIFLDWFHCLYFSIITSTTVGYGDIHPSNGLSMIFSSIQSIVGLLLITMFTVIFGRKFFR